MGYLAPLDIIQRMYETNPSAAFRIDTNGANLLHLACLNGASYDCIDYILSQTAAVSSSSRRGDDEDLATRLDADNKCALHLAVDFACICRKPDDAHVRVHLNTVYDEEQHQPIYSTSVIQRVIWAAPEMLNARDSNDGGDTPIDLVQNIKAETSTVLKDHDEYQRLDEIYKVLLRASIEYYIRRKRVWEEDGHENQKKNHSQEGSKQI